MGINCSNNSKKLNQDNIRDQINQSKTINYDVYNDNQINEGAIKAVLSQKYGNSKYQIQIDDEQNIRCILDGQIMEIDQITDLFQSPENLANLEQEVGGYYLNKGKKNVVKHKFRKLENIIMIEKLEHGNVYMMVVELLVDSIMRMAIRMACGQIQVKDSMIQNKQCIVENIKMVRKLVFGILYGERKGLKTFQGLVVENMMIMRYKSLLKLECGMSWMISLNWVSKWFLQENISMDKKQVDGIFYGGTKAGSHFNKCKLNIQENTISGGGQYNFNDEKGLYKIGRWIELSDIFTSDSQVTCNGPYKNGQKFGRWDIFWREETRSPFQLIGGGQYDDDDGKGSIKIGIWIELRERFKQDSQVTYKGQYRYGQKVGRWDVCYKEQICGGGEYDIKNNGCSYKIGNWIELSDEFREYSQVTYQGKYNYGEKIGKWDIYHKFYNDGWKNEKIGGGSYESNENGCSLKTGKWVELSEGFRNFYQITYQGEYHKGKKIGMWLEKDLKKKNEN
ncbi:unnamed protein product (macronuclear) [Paramecium tetraurelia]|uniref:Uncharacterized protein n=1 Tax=Paramecium tetraurelia TaxID=5888 RepID=A0EH98_PARTE|nr:uncharacterized protein GSPATT00027013001 [Paramecium tetraurelia]CAK94689.1 unnamed protein product [Paramecium tetraurelia]|eukprot:XP_001462062.1 hypothetical protein (macronuclear) [Paramecium tetraurelia strain d4-2]